jgi:hypothetical protein
VLIGMSVLTGETGKEDLSSYGSISYSLFQASPQNTLEFG